MDRNTNTPIESPLTSTQPRVIEYPTLRNTIEISLARQLHVPGAIAARDFDAALAPFSDAERTAIRERVGERFDDELLYFVTCSLLLRKNKTMIITAEASEGFDGYLPWENKLQAHIADRQSDGTLPGAQVIVERYEAPIAMPVAHTIGSAALTRLAA